MIVIDKNISPYIVIDQEPIRDVLRKIDDNEEGMVICVDNAGLLLGVLTDGDFRRWVMDKSHPDLANPVGAIINRNISSALVTDSPGRMASQLSQQVHFLPLTDAGGRCVGLARKRKAQLSIEHHRVGIGHPCFVIAEIGNNHNGSIELAQKLVDEAVLAGADCAKFQLRDLLSLYNNKGNASDAK